MMDARRLYLSVDNISVFRALAPLPFPAMTG
jgi:hypothetical protein